jgi:hypothetical protein
VAAGPAGRCAWLTAVPQAGLLVFLYHARSSLGWQYLALFALVAARVGWWLAVRFCSSRSPSPWLLARPLSVALLLAASLVGLKQYQRTVYHPAYFADHGPRTFWHNALLGLQFHPRLRAELPMPVCEDAAGIDLVLGRMREGDPGLDPVRWNRTAALNSLGNHTDFDWVAYEGAARGVYVDLWRTRPGDMAACHAVHKPQAVASQACTIAWRLAGAVLSGRAWEFLAGAGLFLAAAVVAVRRGVPVWSALRAPGWVVAWLLPFSLIPALAFYPTLVTAACFYLLALPLAGVVGVGLVRYLVRGRAGEAATPCAAPHDR